jgi:acyl transferase domain-containing protein
MTAGSHTTATAYLGAWRLLSLADVVADVHEVVHLHSHTHSVEAHRDDVLWRCAVVARAHIRLERILQEVAAAAAAADSESVDVFGRGADFCCTSITRNMLQTMLQHYSTFHLRVFPLPDEVA